MAERDDWLERIGAIRQWSRAGERAPHKPLLLLYAFGRLQRAGESAASFAEAEPVLGQLLDDFGPPRQSSPAYPFHHLQSDGLWVVSATGGHLGSSPARLRASGAVGSLAPDFEEALRRDPGLLVLAARLLLDANFPESLHGDLCQAAGLDLDALEVAAARGRAAQLRRRDPRFRERILVAYEYRCAMCGYDGRLGSEAVGLDAAHLRWWAFEGPDTVENALCLCTFHHKLLDRGILCVGDDRTVAVSAYFVGRGAPRRSWSCASSGGPSSSRSPDSLSPTTTTSRGTPRRCSAHRRGCRRNPTTTVSAVGCGKAPHPPGRPMCDRRSPQLLARLLSHASTWSTTAVASRIACSASWPGTGAVP